MLLCILDAAKQVKQTLDIPWGFQEDKAPRIPDSLYVKVVR